jgi:hypothetical protein
MIQRVIVIGTIINYEALTDNELNGASNNEKEGDVDVNSKDTDVSSGVDF